MLNNLIFKAYSYINNGNYQAFTNLIDEYPNLLEFKNKNGENLFLYACKKDKSEFFNFFVKNKKHLLESKNQNESNYLHYVFQNNSKNIISEIKKNLSKHKKYLLENNINNVSPIFILAKHGEYEDIMYFFTKVDKKLLDQKDAYQNSIYHYLAYNNKCNKEIIDFIGTNFIQYNQDKITALDIATQYSNYNIFSLFYQNKHTEYYGNIKLLHLSLVNEDDRVFNYLLNQYPEDIDDLLLTSLYENAHLDGVLNNRRIIFCLEKIKEINKLYFKTEEFNIFFNKIISKPDLFHEVILYIYENNVKKIEKDDIFKIFIKSKSESYESILSNLALIEEQDNSIKLQILEKIILNKNEFVSKISKIFKSMDKLNNNEAESFLIHLRKIPLSQQIYLLKQDEVFSKLPLKYKKDIENINKYKVSSVLPDKIGSNIVHFYMDNIHKDHIFNLYLRIQDKNWFLENISKKIKSIKSITEYDFLTNAEKRIFLSNYLKKILKGNMSDIDYISLLKFSNFNKIKIDIDPYNLNDRGQELLIHHNVKFHMDLSKIEKILGTQKELNNNYLNLFNISKDLIGESKKIEQLFDNISISNFSQLKFLYELSKETNKSHIFLNKFLFYYSSYRDDEVKFLNLLITSKENRPEILSLLFNHRYKINGLETHFDLKTIEEQSILNANFYYLKNLKLSEENVKKINISDISPLQKNYFSDFLSITSQTNFNILIDKIKQENEFILLPTILEEFNEKIDTKTKLKFLHQYFQLKQKSPFLIESLDEVKFFQKESDNIEFLSLVLKSSFFNQIDERAKIIMLAKNLNKKLKTNTNTNNKVNKI